MLYTKLLRESLEASCVGVMLGDCRLTAAIFKAIMQEHQVATALCLLFIFGLFFGYCSAEHEYTIWPTIRAE